MRKHYRKLIILTLAILLAGMTVPVGAKKSSDGSTDFWGAQYKGQESTGLQQAKTKSLKQLLRWNEIANNASGLDHTPVQPGENRVFGEQIGPGRASRAMAIVHIAMFESLNAITGGFESYTGLFRASKKTSGKAAVAQAAHDTLVVLFPSQKATFDAALAQDLAELPNNKAKTNGIALGKTSAFTILAQRSFDGSQFPEQLVNVDFACSEDAGKWRQDPISLIPIALGVRWGEVTPFALESGSQFRTPPPPAMNSAAYATAYNEVKRLGGDGTNTPTERTQEQTEIGIYWGYDGVPSLCAPPKLYNQITVLIADQFGLNDLETARLLALVNVAMADAGIASWESKYFYQVWRPITGIREADAGTGPKGAGDGNPATTGDVAFSPLGAPASNLRGPNFTPPFPAYPSGHATFGGALFQTLRRFFGRDNVTFTFVSDEFNGVTKDNSGNVRPLKPRTFTSFSQAEEENGQSRIYLGIHWAYDKTEGIAQGRKIADFAFDNFFRPVN
ncbi:MAG TPA: vanadium-dependent haloperoxidase [Blastocatellia bacterium]|nr:vanadium-dependent haloperoxidase [Blastocatellia bacterium]